MANTRPRELTAQLAFRLTDAEKECLESLTASRVEEARVAGYEIDPSLGAYLRFMIRRDGKAAGKWTDAVSPPTEQKAAKSTAKRRARS